MFDPTSRYASLPDAVYTAPDGRQIVYKERRFLPLAQSLPQLTEVTVAQSDRLDLIAFRTLGRADLFWRICDANDAMDPFVLAIPGTVLRVPVPQP